MYIITFETGCMYRASLIIVYYHVKTQEIEMLESNDHKNQSMNMSLVAVWSSVEDFKPEQPT